MSLVRNPSNDYNGKIMVIPPYAAFEDGPTNHSRMRPTSGIPFESRQCRPCFADDYGREQYARSMRQLQKSRSFSQMAGNPVVTRSEHQSSPPAKVSSIPLYNSLEDPHLEDYYKKKFKAQKSRPATTLVGNGCASVDACAVYKVVIATGDMHNAGTYANVFIRMTGARGKLNKIKLKKPLKEKHRVESGKKLPFHFAPSSVHSFKVYCPDLGDLKSIVLEHDGLEKRDGWFVEYVEITNVTRAYTWYFKCHDWLSAYRSDGKISRDLLPERVEVSDYEVVIVTGDKDGCDTDANVFITLFGREGHTGRLPLTNRKRPIFRKAQTDRFVLRARNVGRLKKIRIEHDNSGYSPDWFVERIVVFNRDDPKHRYFFQCGTWLSSSKEDNVISREFLASLNPLDGRKERRYKIVTYTGNMPDAGTDSDIFIKLVGELASSEHMRLETPYLRSFERNGEDAFLMRMPSVGQIRKIKIRNCNNGIHPAWFLNKVIVEDLHDNRIYIFPCQRWIGGDRSRGHVWVELLPGKENQYVADKGMLIWNFKVYTSNISNAGTDAHVFAQIYGDKGKTKVLRFSGAGEKFETGKVDNISVEAEDIGTPYKLRVWHDEKGVAPGWHLEKVELLAPPSRKFFFPCGKWLSADEDHGEVVRELPANGDGIDFPLPVLEYEIHVFTGSKFGSGTDANVSICLNGERGDSGDRLLRKSMTNKNKFETGKVRLTLFYLFLLLSISIACPL